MARIIPAIVVRSVAAIALAGFSSVTPTLVSTVRSNDGFGRWLALEVTSDQRSKGSVDLYVYRGGIHGYEPYPATVGVGVYVLGTRLDATLMPMDVCAPPCTTIELVPRTRPRPSW